MAYYKKQDIFSFVKETIKRLEEADSNFKPLISEEEVAFRVNNNEMVVGFFWFEIINNSIPKQEGKVFVRLDENLYTDDRFALDAYQAHEQGITVSQIIKNREEEQDFSKKTINK